MGTRKPRELPARLEATRRRFEDWRRTRRSRSRIPGPLWASAVKLAGKYGIHRTAKALRVDYYALKKRVEETCAATAGKTSAEVAKPRFLELPAAPWVGSGECTLELEDAGGAKMRIHVKGAEALDLVALSRSFWNLES